MRKPIRKKQIETIALSSPVHFIDIRSAQEYEKQHIPIATHIPAEKLETALEQFPKNDTLICVCNHGKERSQAAAEFLYDHGFVNACYLEGGTSGWFDQNT